MKCHLFILVCLHLIASNAKADAEAETLPIEDLQAEHRSAKPEPFLDKIAAFFAGGNTRKHDKKQTYPQQTAASVPRPQYVRPPLPPQPPKRPTNLLQKRPPKPPPSYDQQTSASQNFGAFTNQSPGKIKTMSETFFWEKSFALGVHFIVYKTNTSINMTDPDIVEIN